MFEVVPHTEEHDSKEEDKKQEEETEKSEKLNRKNYGKDGLSAITTNTTPTKNKEAALPALPKTHLRSSSKVTVKNLKKFVAAKLGLPSSDQLDLLCCGEKLGMDHSLEFIQRTRWHETTPLVLTYRLINLDAEML